MTAQVTKIQSKSYTIRINGGDYEATPRGSIKQLGKILVGDNVEVIANDYGNGYVITKILPRRNALVRPPVANLEQLVIVMAVTPAPDFELVDKLFIYCAMQDIKPILVINKCDIANHNQIMDIINQYKYCTENIFAVSALTNEGLAPVVKLLKGKLSAFAGQSAVGKSTLLNAIIGQDIVATGGLSARTERGKHTTRHTEIYVLDDDIMIADTAGFSMLELGDMDYNDLCNYYPDFASNDACSYSGCTHINCTSNDCAVVADVEANVIHKDRYARYVKMYAKLKENWRRRYD